MSQYSENGSICQALSDNLQDETFDWRGKKVKTLRLDDLYRLIGYDSYATRAKSCCTALDFKSNLDETERKIAWGNFCNLRLCPLCTSRKAYHTARRLTNALRQCREEHGCQYLFLTLTIRNVPSGQLGAAITLLTKAWSKLLRHRRVERAVKGWFRAIEITYKGKGYHPHIHAILAVEDDYFDRSKGQYITHDEWVKRWRKALQVDYDPSVDIRSTRQAGGAQKSLSAAVEAAKYTVKDVEFIDKKLPKKKAAALVKEYTDALRNRRLVAYGGWLSKYAEAEAEDELSDDMYDLLLSYGWTFGAGDYLLRSVVPLHEGVDVRLSKDTKQFIVTQKGDGEE